MAEIQKGGYLTAGPVMCLFYNSPETTAQKDLDWQVMVPVINPGPMAKPQYDQMGFQFSDVTNVAYIYHVGPYDKINETYRTLFDWAKRNRLCDQGLPGGDLLERSEHHSQGEAGHRDLHSGRREESSTGGPIEPRRIGLRSQD